MEIIQLDKNLLSKFVLSACNSHFRQSYEWGEILTYDGSKRFCLGVKDNGELIVGVTFNVKKLPFMRLSYLYAPRGPLLAEIDFQRVRAALNCLVEEIKKIGDSCGAIFMRVDPDFRDENETIKKLLLTSSFQHLANKKWSFLNYPRILMRIDLKKSEEDLLKTMRKKARQHIKTALTEDIEIIRELNLENLRVLYEIVLKVGKKKGFPVRSFNYFEKIYEQFGPSNGLIIRLAFIKGIPFSGVLSLRYGEKCWYLYGGFDDAYKQFHVNELLHWEIIKWARENGCIFYDLGGSATDYPPPEDTTANPLYHFKKGLGAAVIFLTGYYDFVFRKTSYPVFRFLEERILPYGYHYLYYLVR